MFQSKGIMTLFMMFVMTMCCFAAHFTRDPSGKCGDDCSWTLDESSGKLTISGTGGIEDKLKVWDDYKESIRSVVINSGITSIGSKAFKRFPELTSVTIPDSVTSIGVDAFDDCEKIEFAPYDNGLYLGNSANKYYALVGIKDVHNYSMVLNENVKVIEEGILDFYEDFSFNRYSNGYYIGTSTNPYFYLRYGNDTASTTCVIHNNCKIIGSYAFKGSSKMKSIIIGRSVTTILSYAFRDCRGLTSMIIPNSVTSIGERAFVYCDGLKSITIGKSVEQIYTGAFSYCHNLTSVCYLGSTEFKTDLFEGSDELKKVAVTDNYKGSTFSGKQVTKDETCIAPTNKKWAVKVTIEVKSGDSFEPDASSVIKDVQEISGVTTKDLVADFDFDENGHIIAVIVSTDDKNTAQVIADKIDAMDKGSSCKYGVLCRSKGAKVFDAEEVSNSVRCFDSLFIMAIVILMMLW